MNCVLRIETAARSFIIKQSRGYVENTADSCACIEYLPKGFYEKIARSKSAADHARAHRY
jgi:5-methylthioribose kinase